MPFQILAKSLDDIPHKSVYNNTNPYLNKSVVDATYWILRVKVNEEGTGLSLYNEADESIIIEKEVAIYTCEFSKNQLLMTTMDIHMYLINDW